MPLLDVSWVTQDPMLADVFTVSRWADEVGANGRTVPAIQEVFRDVMGVVTQQSPSALMNKDDQTTIPRRIFIATTFRARANSRDADGVQYQADLIHWGGTTYKVVDILPYTSYGAGTVEVIAESQTAVDLPPE